MKNLFLTFLLLSALTSKAQYNDTLYYKSGRVKPVTVRQHDEKFLTYEYGNKKGKLVSMKIKLDALEYFVIYNEYNELVHDSRQPKKKEEE